MPPNDNNGSREIYFEFIAVGAVVKVSAIDPQTGIEVTVMGPATALRADLERLALQKLKARLARESGAEASAVGKRPGKLV